MNEMKKNLKIALNDEELAGVTGGYLYFHPTTKKWVVLTNQGGFLCEVDSKEEAMWYINAYKSLNLTDRELNNDEFRNLMETGDPDNYPE